MSSEPEHYWWAYEAEGIGMDHVIYLASNCKLEKKSWGQ